MKTDIPAHPHLHLQAIWRVNLTNVKWKKPNRLEGIHSKEQVNATHNFTSQSFDQRVINGHQVTFCPWSLSSYTHVMQMSVRGEKKMAVLQI